MAKSKSTKSKSKNTGNKNKSNTVPKHVGRMRDEIKGLIFLALGAFLIFALYISAAGKLGEVIKMFLLGLMGHIAFILPFILIIYGVLLLFKQIGLRGIRATILFFALFLVLMLLNAGRFLNEGGDPDPSGTFLEIYKLSGLGDSGGIIGIYVGGLIVSLIGKSGLYIFSILALIIFCILAVNTPLSQYIETLNDRWKERRERKYEQWEEEEKQRELDENASKKALKVGRRSPKEIPLEEQLAASKISDLSDTPAIAAVEKARTDEIQIEDTMIEQSASKIPATTEFAQPDPLSRKKLEEKQKNIMDLAKNDEIFGARAESEGLGLEPLREGTVAADDIFSDNNDSDIENGPVPNTDKHVEKKSGGDLSGFTGFSKTQNRDEEYKLPPINLLSKGPVNKKTDSVTQLKEKARKLEQTLQDFKVDASVLKVTVGPTVTRYEVQPNVGVKINAIKSLESDLALNLEVKSVRVVPMSSGKVIGIEAYNENTSLVTLRDLIDSPEFREQDSKIAFALGKNISGHRIVANLKTMPHLLIAGTTGSGKSVCINSILLSILYRATPQEVQLILVDPKVVELKSYNGIPHLAMPVVTDPDKAAAALEHAVREMNRRYNKFAEENVRNISNFNEKVRKEDRNDEVMPEIVIVIDELADLMLVASQKVQDSISRLAAMARAAGMHLIVATQQPLASIVTSVIKANIPSRIAFSVSSNSASRVILDDSGAERLLGNGDMLYHPVGERESMRIQGAFVTDSEVHKVTDYVKKQASPDYIPDILESLNTETTGKLVEEEDDLYQDAVDTVISANQASTSMLQRRFRIGYNRAARLMEMLEDRGIVGPQDGSRPRKVLVQDSMEGGQQSDQMIVGEDNFDE